ncbi:hypothetical protein MHU86_5448 [Fragilaria crotonensis]|nr:hypothetical protein MHU86_5448 [Fragilaria crotonensis]
MKIMQLNCFVAVAVAFALGCCLSDATTTSSLQSAFATYRRSNDNLDYSKQVALGIRGGEVLVTEAADEDESSIISVNPYVTKVRNVLRSLLEIGDRRSPKIAEILRSVIGKIESVFGIKLLPQAEPKLKKKNKKARKTKKAKKTEVDIKETKSSETEESKSKKTTTPVANKAAQQHMTSKISTTNPNYRVQRELKEFIKSPPPNLSVKVGSNIRIWIITMTGAANTIYEGETYKLRVQFPKDYPIVPPSVYFLPPTPQHEHVYTNGDICLSLLGKDWRPTMTAQSIAVSILSILSSAQSKSLPMDNARHSQNKPGQFQKDWVYHDDNC